MASVNRVILLGRLGNTPELRFTSTQRAVTELRVATSRRYKGRDEQWVEQTEWHTVIVWGRDAENCERYLAKGREVFIEGRLQTRSWQDAQSGQKRFKTEIVAERVQFVGGRGDDAGRASASGNQPAHATPAADALPPDRQRLETTNDDAVHDIDGEVPF